MRCLNRVLAILLLFCSSCSEEIQKEIGDPVTFEKDSIIEITRNVGFPSSKITFEKNEIVSYELKDEELEGSLTIRFKEPKNINRKDIYQFIKNDLIDTIMFDRSDGYYTPEFSVLIGEKIYYINKRNMLSSYQYLFGVFQKFSKLEREMFLGSNEEINVGTIDTTKYLIDPFIKRLNFWFE